MVSMTAPEATLDYAMRHSPPGLAPYALRVKPGGIYRFMRNMSVDKGMVKNMQCVITDLGSRLITVRFVRGAGSIGYVGTEEVLIPHINFNATFPASRYTLMCRQIPLAPAYATTFNSCQGLTLDCVVVDLTRPVFSHGQLYTALSRVRHRSHARIRLEPGNTSTQNVTYEELLI
jgi:hypothetical protein